MPKFPKGLKASIAKLERQKERAKAITKRKQEIAKMKAKRAALLKAKRGY